MLENVLDYQYIILNNIQFGGASKKDELKIVHQLINIIVCSDGCYGAEKQSFAIKWSKMNPSWNPNIISGHHGLVYAKLSSHMIQGSKFGVQKGDFDPKKDVLLHSNHGDQDPRLMFFCDTMI